MLIRMFKTTNNWKHWKWDGFENRLTDAVIAYQATRDNILQGDPYIKKTEVRY